MGPSVCALSLTHTHALSHTYRHTASSYSEAPEPPPPRGIDTAVPLGLCSPCRPLSPSHSLSISLSQTRRHKHTQCFLTLEITRAPPHTFYISEHTRTHTTSHSPCPATLLPPMVICAIYSQFHRTTMLPKRNELITPTTTNSEVLQEKSISRFFRASDWSPKIFSTKRVSISHVTRMWQLNSRIALQDLGFTVEAVFTGLVLSSFILRP